MNKKLFIEKLSNELGYPLEKCVIINDILEDNFFISNSNEDKIISKLVNALNVNHDEGLRIYEKSITIIKGAIKEKIKHPLKDQD